LKPLKSNAFSLPFRRYVAQNGFALVVDSYMVSDPKRVPFVPVF
jgi:hypothetical protein